MTIKELFRWIRRKIRKEVIVMTPEFIPKKTLRRVKKNSQNAIIVDISPDVDLGNDQ